VKPLNSKNLLREARAVALVLPLLALASFSSLRAQDTVAVKRVILAPRIVSDDFGKRIAQSHLAVQVTVTNNSKDKDIIIQNAALDLTKALNPTRVDFMKNRVEEINAKLGLRGGNRYLVTTTSKFSSIDLELLQGVVQKGQQYDLRNQAYRTILAIGTIGAGLVGVAGLGPVLPKAVAAWTGPGLTAFSTLFPDLTVDEVIRLSNQAYSANMIIPKEKSRVFVVFLPLDLILTAQEKKQFWGHSNDFLSITKTPATLPDLAQLEVELDAKFIVPVNDVPPNVTDIIFDAQELDNFAAARPVHGSIAGRFLDGASVSLLEGDALGLDITLDTARVSGDNRLYFVITPKKVVPAGSRLTFQLTKEKQVTSFSKLLTHHLPAPTFTSLDPAKGVQKTDVPVKIGGSAFFDGDVTILVDGSSDPGASGIKMNAFTVKDSSHIEVTFSIDEKAKTGGREIQILTSGGLTGAQKFNVSAKP
jgi:hypothetical protein